MAVYQFSALADGQAISFNPNSDVLYFDQWPISAALLRVTVEGANLRIGYPPEWGGKDVVLLNVSNLQLATSNTLFADGSRLLYGDNSPGTAGDNSANSLTGTDNGDQLAGFGGADTLNGGLGNDAYYVSTGDTIIDAGGIDTVYSDVSWALNSSLENLTLIGTAAGTLNGNWLNNVLIGNDARNSSINGRAGDDIMYGMGGNDTFDMSTGGTSSYGNDYIDGGRGIDTVEFGANARSEVYVDLEGMTMTGGGDGHSGRATLISIESFLGGNFADHVTGTAGNNTLIGGAGNDTLIGAGGNDRLEGGSGADRYVFNVTPGAANADTVVGFFSGSDKIVLVPQAYSNIGAAGNFSAGDARFASGAGFNSGRDASDRIIYNTSTGQLWYDADGSGAGAAQLIATLQGNPTLTATDIAVGGSGTVITGTSGNDSLIGTTSGDTIDGLAGNDTMNGGGGADVLIGGTGNDSIYGGVNDVAYPSGYDPGDRLIGGDGDDTLDGSQPRGSVTIDTLDGGLGNDLYVVDNAGDVLSDSGGVDTVDARDVSFTLGAGFENLIIRNDVSEGGQTGIGNDLNNRISVTYGTATVHGGGGNDTLLGGAKSVKLFGDAGNDSLVGGDSFDFLDGGTGNDTLTGNDGASFVFSATPGTANADVITDFAGDGIRLDGTVMPQIGASGNFAVDDGRFYAAAGATGGHDADDRVVYNTTTGQLFYDADGSGAGAAQLLATLQGAPELTASHVAVDNGTSGQAINGTSGTDSLVGTAGNDTIDGLGGNDTIDGLAGNDSLIGGDGDDVLIGLEGFDTIAGGAGFDTQIIRSGLAGAGIEKLVLRGYDSVSGADGHGNELDNLIVDEGPGNAYLYGNGGNDTVIGGSGLNFFVFNGNPSGSSDAYGNDSVDGGGGIDWLLFENNSAAVTVDFRTGTVTGGSTVPASVTFVNIERAQGTLFNDNMFAGDGGNTLGGYGGNDTLTGGAGNDDLSGDSGFGHPTVAPGNDRLLGGAGNDTLGGEEGSDWLDGGTGNDWLLGSGGDVFSDGPDSFAFTVAPGAANADQISDFLSGSDKVVLDGNAHAGIGSSGNFAAGDARFFAGAGANAGQDASDRVIYNTTTGQLWYDADGSGAGAAQLIATLEGAPILTATDISIVNGSSAPPPPPSGNVITGTSGNDSLTGTSGDDTIDGGAGADTMNGGQGNDTYYVTSGDVIQDSSGVDQIFAAESFALPSPIENITYTGTANTTSAGNWQANAMTGNSGKNYLDGREANDTLAGAAGNDTLKGAAGADTFVFAEMGTANADSISDFASGTDKIGLDDAAFALSGSFVAGDARFRAGAGLSSGQDADDRVIYNTSTGQLYYDADGSGAGAAQLIAMLQGNPALAATDITVI